MAAHSSCLRDVTFHWTGFGTAQASWSLGMGFADLTCGEFCCSKLPRWPTSPFQAHKLFTHWAGSPSLGAGMEGASGLGWRENLPKKRQERPKPHFHGSPRAQLSPGVWASCGKPGTWSPNKTKQCCPFPAALSLLPFLC